MLNLENYFRTCRLFYLIKKKGGYAHFLVTSYLKSKYTLPLLKKKRVSIFSFEGANISDNCYAYYPCQVLKNIKFTRFKTFNFVFLNKAEVLSVLKSILEGYEHGSPSNILQNFVLKLVRQKKIIHFESSTISKNSRLARKMSI